MSHRPKSPSRSSIASVERPMPPVEQVAQFECDDDQLDEFLNESEATNPGDFDGPPLLVMDNVRRRWRREV